MFKKGKLLPRLLLYALAIVGIAAFINFLMGVPIPTATSLNAPTWLTFWGSYLGGAIGCLPALAALYDNRKEARKQHAENEKSRRLAVMPVFDCRIRHVSTEYAKDDFSKYLLIDFTGTLREGDFDDWLELDCYPECHYIDLCNCGLGPALQAKLCFKNHRVDLFNLKNGYTSHYIFVPCDEYFLSSNAEHTMCLTVECQDIYGNHYAQELSFKVSRSFQDKMDYLSFQTVSVGTARLVGHV